MEGEKLQYKYTLRLRIWFCQHIFSLAFTESSRFKGKLIDTELRKYWLENCMNLVFPRKLKKICSHFYAEHRGGFFI